MTRVQRTCSFDIQYQCLRATTIHCTLSYMKSQSWHPDYAVQPLWCRLKTGRWGSYDIKKGYQRISRLDERRGCLKSYNGAGRITPILLVLNLNEVQLEVLQMCFLLILS